MTHDCAGIDGGRFVAALVSQAFTTADPVALIEAGLAQIAPDGAYARVINAVLDHYRSQPDDWRACQRMLAEEFGPQRYGGPVHIIPNPGVIALALLYGGGDFGRAICIATMVYWDTDCNAGNVGAIMGVALGLGAIGPAWRGADQRPAAGGRAAGQPQPDRHPRLRRLVQPPGRAYAGAGAAARAATLSLRLPRLDPWFPGRCAARPGAGVAPGRLRRCSRSRRAADHAPQPEQKRRGQRLVADLYSPAELSANNYQASFS